MKKIRKFLINLGYVFSHIWDLMSIFFTVVTIYIISEADLKKIKNEELLVIIIFVIICLIFWIKIIYDIYKDIKH